jgi:glycosyltransferase involved in cell wall biosynthesis
MQLAVNGIRLVGKRFGVGRYVEYLLRHWKGVEHPFDKITVYVPAPLNDEIDLPIRTELQVIPTSAPYGYWEQVLLTRHSSNHDLLFCPSYVCPVLRRGKTVLTHLGSYEALPSAFPLLERWKSRGLYQLSARRADRVITVSESSKRDIVRFYGIAPDKISVISLGVDPMFRPIRDEGLLIATRTRYIGSDRPYILFIGKLSRRRNIPELVAAFGRLKRERHIPQSLLLIGENSVHHDIERLAAAHDVQESVIHLDFASHRELVTIYNAADLFIYPSSYEGFGIPVLEAMACGVPSIALRNSSFLEFAVETIYLAQDGNADELFRAMESVLFSDSLRAKMRAAGPLKAEQFGWQSIARQTMDLLCQVARQ